MLKKVSLSSVIPQTFQFKVYITYMRGASMFLAHMVSLYMLYTYYPASDCRSSARLSNIFKDLL